jgi:hypothetical protein
MTKYLALIVLLLISTGCGDDRLTPHEAACSIINASPNDQYLDNQGDC